MSDELNDALESGMKGAAEGFAKGIAEKVPLYTDLIQPGAKALGKGIENAIRIALAPISATIWGIEKTSDWLEKRLTNKLSKIDESDIVSPKGSIVGPAIEAIKFLSSEDELREMFAQLIATSLNRNQAEIAHPGFVEIIKNMSTADAVVLKHIEKQSMLPTIDFWITLKESNVQDLGDTINVFMKDLNLESRWNGREILKNLERLGLIERKLAQTVEENVFASLESDEDLKSLRIKYKDLTVQGAIQYFESKIVYVLTALGENFTSAVFDNPNE